MSRTARGLAAPALVLALVVLARAADPKTAVTDPAQAGPDFAIQGEYAGGVDTDQGKVEVGFQVIALGEGKFQGVGYEGGLPGAGWKKTEKRAAEGELKDGVCTFKAKDAPLTATLKGGTVTIRNTENNQVIGTLKKIERKSPTLGQQPPAGAVVLFDGKTAENLKGGRMTPDGLLMEGATSKQNFGSFTAHVEFVTPFMPSARGQARGNSGFYAQGRYEVQILDSFGLEGQSNECGGIYGVAKPAVNMCLPPLAWQTYDVDFTAAEYKDGQKVKNARMTVRHNGVLIYENVEVPKTTVAAPVRDGPEPGPIFLQNHGNPVRFRNIWVVEKK